MQLDIPESVAKVVATIDGFLRERVLPRERALLAVPFSAALPELEALRDEVRRLGLWLPQGPRELGGMGLRLYDFAFVSEALGRTPYGHFLFGCQAPDAGNLEILHLHGTAEQKARWLEPLAHGRIRSCFSMTEPENPGSNPTELACRAAQDGDHYVIDGHKWFTSSADGAAFAIVMAVTNPDAPPHQRASQIIVPTDAPGFERVRNIGVMGHAGDGWASHAEVRYREVRVPVTNRLGAEGAGFAIAQERLGPGRIHHCMRWLGIASRAFDLLCERALSRRVGAERLADKEFVQGWIAESAAAIRAARLLVLDAAARIDRLGFAAAREEIALIKFHVARVMSDVVDRAVQAHGALGVSEDTVLWWFYAQERGARIYDGPDEVHLVSAARQILKRYGA